MEKCSLLISNFKKMSCYNLNNTPPPTKILNVNINKNTNKNDNKNYEDMFFLLIN